MKNCRRFESLNINQIMEVAYSFFAKTTPWCLFFLLPHQSPSQFSDLNKITIDRAWKIVTLPLIIIPCGVVPIILKIYQMNFKIQAAAKKKVFTMSLKLRGQFYLTFYLFRGAAHKVKCAQVSEVKLSQSSCLNGYRFMAFLLSFGTFRLINESKIWQISSRRFY